MNAIDKLKKTNNKLTRPRRLVLEYLAKQRKPKTTQDIIAGLRGQIDQVSVYRAVELMHKLDIIYEDFLLDQRRFYLADLPHHHIACRKCKKIDCLPCASEISVPKGYTAISHIISITGLCQACA